MLQYVHFPQVAQYMYESETVQHLAATVAPAVSACSIGILELSTPSCLCLHKQASHVKYPQCAVEP